MRCRCCNRPDSNPVLDDWYCRDCEVIIRKTAGHDFTMEDLYRIMEEGEEDDISIHTRKSTSW